MKHYTFLIFILSTFVSCKTKPKPSTSSYSEIATITNKTEQYYLDQTLSDISNVSILAKDYVTHLPLLEAKAKELELFLKNQQSVPIASQKDFIDSFANSLKYLNLSDSLTLDLLRESPITCSEDVDQLLLFMKRTFVNKASQMNRYFFNIVGTSYSFENIDIKKGENIFLTMNITAANSNVPAEWFILKDGGAPLTKENISDTLYPDQYGDVKFKKKIFQTGKNWIQFATKIPSSDGEIVLYKAAYFNVR